MAGGAGSNDETPPLSIARQGYLFAGGKIGDGPGRPMTGHLYAEFQIPHRLEHPFPIVMIHGGGQTGTNFTGTPDGREGWAQFFLRRGYTVYVVDQVGRGRAACWTDVYGPQSKPRYDMVVQRFTSPARFERWPQAHLHTQFPAASPEPGLPGDAVFEQFYASQVPAIASFAEQQRLNRDALIALLDKIGPAILLTHSQSGTFHWPVADARPDLVKAIVAVEPNGPPVHEVLFHGAPDYFSEDEHTKLSGLGEVPLTYSPPVTETSPLEFVRQEKADAPDLVPCWRQKEPARKLPNLMHIPLLILTAEASYHAPYDHCTSQYLEQAGVRHTFIRLADRGIRGNGHMMMLEKNNAEIAALIAEWLEDATKEAEAACRAKR